MKLVLLACCAAVLLVAGLPGGAGASPPNVTYSCSPSPCTGWHTSPVTVTWTVTGATDANCGVNTVSTDTTGKDVSCTASNGPESITVTVTIKLDQTPPTVGSVSLARGPDENGWYNHPVGFSVGGTDATSGIASCTSATYSGPDSGNATVSGTCRDQAGNVSAAATATIRYDSTAPSVEARPARAPDANGWYDKPVSVAGAGSDGGSGIDSCSSGSYSGPDAAAATVTVSCTDRAGNSASASATIPYDATPPTARPVPARRPDANGWYNHPVQIAFAGADATSGIGSCTSVTYSGPASAAAKVTGTCTDKAGNTSPAASFSLRYDSTPPALSGVQALPAAKAATLTWQASPDTRSIEILRTPGIKGHRTTRVYNGHAGKRGVPERFRDRKVREGVRYRYTVVVIDIAGNRRARAVSVRVRDPMIAPRNGARLSRAPTLRWRPVRGASYYNVQLFHGKTKVLTLWPAKPKLALHRTWKYRGHRLRLAPGRYRWYVWPGRGKPSKHVYGALLGTRAFVVAR